MLDVWLGEFNLAALLLVFSLVVLLPLQLLLCFKAASLPVRLAPVLVLAAAAAVFGAASLFLIGWEGLLAVFLALYALCMLPFCALGWGIWALLRWLTR